MAIHHHRLFGLRTLLLVSIVGSSIGCYSRWDMPASRVSAFDSHPSGGNLQKDLIALAPSDASETQKAQFADDQRVLDQAKRHCYYLDSMRGRWGVAAAISGSLAGASGVSGIASVAASNDPTPSSHTQRNLAITFASLTVAMAALTAGAVVAANSYDKDFALERCPEVLNIIPGLKRLQENEQTPGPAPAPAPPKPTG